MRTLRICWVRSILVTENGQGRELTTSSGSSQIAEVCLSLPSSLWVSGHFCNQTPELTDIVNPQYRYWHQETGVGVSRVPFYAVMR